MKIVLIGNYLQDRQESMERFALMLDAGFREAGVKCQIWRPKVLLGTWFENTTFGLGKWFGYIDKWVLFPLILLWRLRNKEFNSSQIRFHVCDHSNSPYLKYLPANRTGITCHDVIAIRGGMGFADAHNPASGLGKVLQKWILSYLRKANLLASVSNLTLRQLQELVNNQESVSRDWRVIHNAFNADFKPVTLREAHSLIKKAGLDPSVPFILHVGSKLPRKNRKLLLDMVASLGDCWHGNVCYSGKGVDEALMSHAKSLGLTDRIVSVVKPDHATLEALYSSCEAFVFPSFSEGFGWPVIEAQACGAPVIASNIEPMPEISGGAALHADPTKPEEFANAFLSLNSSVVRGEIVQRGFKNCRRFTPEKIMDEYLALHSLERKKVNQLCY